MWVTFHQFDFCNPIFSANFHYNVNDFVQNNVLYFFPDLINTCTKLQYKRDPLLNQKARKRKKNLDT